MRMIRGFVFAITGLSIFISLLSLLIPSTVMVTRGVVVNANAKKVMLQVSSLQNWKNWQPVFKSGTYDIRFNAGNNGTDGSSEWESNGKKNSLFITGHTEYSITISLRSEDENEVIHTISILPLADSNTVQVEWRALTLLKWYPWEKFYGIFIEKVTGQGYEDALNNLKAYVENH